MSKGQRYPAESKEFRDERTGALIRQVTSHPSIHHFPFFFVCAYDDAMRRLYFISHRTGSPQLFAEDRATKELVQLTDRPELNAWSIYPSRDGRYVYFTAGLHACRLCTETLEEELLLDLSEYRLREAGDVGSGMGTTALTPDGRYWALRVSSGGLARLVVIDTQTKESQVILERDEISHLIFSTDDPSLLFYAGPLTDRVWSIRRDGSENRRIYRRDDPLQWVTHESWLAGTGELLFVDWPKGMRAVDLKTGRLRQVTGVNAWHAIANRDGNLCVADTNLPDRGIVLFNPRENGGEVRTLCYPHSSNAGAHWGGPFPYNNGPIKVYAPQHTHPHPNFSPDHRLVTFNSDRSGFAQVYEVALP